MGVDIKSINTINKYVVQLKKNIVSMGDLITPSPVTHSLNDYQAYLSILRDTSAGEAYLLYGYRLLAVLYSLRDKLLSGTKMNNDNYVTLISATRVLLYENNVHNKQD